MFGLVLDRVWWESGLNKYEKGIAVLEHYHWGLIAWILAYVVNVNISFFLWGVGLALVMAEWAQTGEWKDSVWSRGHPFAYGSDHFLFSTVIGLALIAVHVLALILIFMSML
ncbi:MAG: hypothetical protein QXH97_00300 [Candidatus Bathyarchaeia archaeon]